jgi:hypothetical protein
MPAAPFMAAGLGNMASNMSEGLVKAPLMERMMKREDTQDLQRQQLQDATLQDHEIKRKAGFMTGAMNFYKVTRDPTATLKFWNEEAPKIGLPKLTSIDPDPSDPDSIKITHVTTDGQQVPYIANVSKGTIAPFKTQQGTAFSPQKSAKQLADEQAAGVRGLIMSGQEVDPNVAAGAGVRLPTDQKPEYTPAAAYKRLTELSVVESKIDKASVMDAMIATLIGKPELVGQPMDPSIKNSLKSQIAAERDYVNSYIGSGGGGQSRADTTLQGKRPGRYRIGNQIIKWDGQQVIQ